MPDSPHERNWQVRMVRAGILGLNQLPARLGMPELSKLTWLFHPIRPADIGEGMRETMLDKENIIEDVNYQKVIPNRFVVQVSPENYQRQFHPIERNIIQQWQENLLAEIITANSRRGRKEFRLGGPLRIEIRPSGDLKETEARILSMIEPGILRDNPPGVDVERISTNESGGTRPSVETTLTTAYLELVPDGQWWTIYTGINTIGRSELCQVYLNQPVVQEKRLISGLHAFIVMENGVCFLFDGSPDGRPSSNGTYVNFHKIPSTGYRLQNGDSILLAAINPQNPRSDTPGVATLNFWFHRKV